TRGRTERIGVIDEAAPRDRHRLETPVGMLWKAGDDGPVIHAPTTFALEVLTEVATGKGCGRPKSLVAGWISVSMMDAEEKGILRHPRRTERPNLEHHVLHDRKDSCNLELPALHATPPAFAR